MKRILIIQTAFLGDVILATAMTETLHLHYPEAYIDMLVKKQNLAPLMKHPYLNNVLTLDKEKNKSVELFRLLKTIRSKRYDAVINIQRFFTSGFLTAFSGAKIRSGYSKNPFSFLFTHTYDHPLENTHETVRNHTLISFLKIDKPSLPKIYIPEDDEKFVGHLKQKPYICIAPASVWFTKQYPVEKWIEFLDTVPENICVYMLGAASDIKICNEISEKTIHSNSITLCGKLTLLQSASLMKDAIMNYVNDSAPLHITSAVNAPVTAIFCSTIPDFGFGPLSDDTLVVQTHEQLTCRPCGIHGHRTCPEKHFRCAISINNTILTDRIIHKLK